MGAGGNTTRMGDSRDEGVDEAVDEEQRDDRWDDEWPDASAEEEGRDDRWDEEWSPQRHAGEDEDEASAEEQRAEGERRDEVEPRAQGADEDGGREDRHGSEDDETELTAPSVGPHTTFDREPPEERLARHEQSDVDAMGLDKRRAIVGGTYGPTRRRQMLLYGSVLLVVTALAICGVLLANRLDQPPANQDDTAPWAAPKAEQHEPRPLQ